MAISGEELLFIKQGHDANFMNLKIHCLQKTYMKGTEEVTFLHEFYALPKSDLCSLYRFHHLSI